MATYIVTYDLHQPGENYNDLYTLIKAYDHIPIAQSTWGVKTSDTATEVRDYLRQVLDNNDKLFVNSLDSWASWALPTSVTNWLHGK